MLFFPQTNALAYVRDYDIRLVSIMTCATTYYKGLVVPQASSIKYLGRVGFGLEPRGAEGEFLALILNLAVWH